MTLIKQWREAWKFSSVQTAVILGLANTAFFLLPKLDEVISLPVYAAISALGNVAIIVLRLIAQPKIEKSPKRKSE